MAGKAPLLLATVLFAIGVSGLALSSAERAHWGPFEPGSTPAVQQVRIVDSGTPFAVPPLDELFTSHVETAVSSEPAPAAPSAPAAVATIPPLRVYGISSDDGGVSAAAAAPTPPPVTIVNVANDDDIKNRETPKPPEVVYDSPPEQPVANSNDVVDPPASEKPHELPVDPEPTPVTVPEATPTAD